MAQVQKNEDIAPSLIKSVQDAVNANVRSNQRLANLRGLIGEGRATYKDMAEYAREYGKMVKRAMASNVSSAVLPDGKMYWNIADRLFDQVMTEEFNEISQQCEQVQTALNQAAGIGVKAQVPELDPEKIKGLNEYASRSDWYDDVKASVENALITYSQSLVDESVKKNADFQAKYGMHPRIIRSAAPGCCRWCTMLAGSYDYPEDTPDDVFKRHANCNCVVEYYPRDGRRQNVWTKVWSKAFKSDKEIDTNYSNVDMMGDPETIEIPDINKKVRVFKSETGDNIWTQTYTGNSQKMVEYLHQKINVSNEFGNVHRIYVVKRKSLNDNHAAYDRKNNDLYIAEELINEKKFSEIVNSKLFAARNIDEVVIHELGGHKRYWDNIKAYASEHGISDKEAQRIVDEPIRKYVETQQYYDVNYLEKVASKYSREYYINRGEINELVAEMAIHIHRGDSLDKELARFVKAVLRL